MEPPYTYEVFRNVYSGTARFKIGIQILPSNCATAVQASAVDLIEYIEKQIKKEKNKKKLTKQQSNTLLHRH